MKSSTLKMSTARPYRRQRRLNADGVNLRKIPALRQPFRVISIERLGLSGVAPKNFIVLPPEKGFTHAYIAKQPTKPHSGVRECVIEYLIAEIGRRLPLQMARGRLVKLRDGTEGSPDVRFMSRYFLEYNREQLRHGVELVASAFDVGVKSIAQELNGREDEQRFYTIDILDEVLDYVATSKANHFNLRDAFARMLTFDALIGAVDRHAENWGIIEDVRGYREPRFAPIYDTASGLFVRVGESELPSSHAEAGRRIEQYANKSKPLIGTGSSGPVSHFELVEYLLRQRGAKYGRPVRQVVNGFQPKRMSGLIWSFQRYLSRRRIELIDGLLRYRHRVLKGLIEGNTLEQSCRYAKWAENSRKS